MFSLKYILRTRCPCVLTERAIQSTWRHAQPLSDRAAPLSRRNPCANSSPRCATSSLLALKLSGKVGRPEIKTRARHSKRSPPLPGTGAYRYSIDCSSCPQDRATALPGPSLILPFGSPAGTIEWNASALHNARERTEMAAAHFTAVPNTRVGSYVYAILCSPFRKSCQGPFAFLGLCRRGETCRSPTEYRLSMSSNSCLMTRERRRHMPSSAREFPTPPPLR